MYCPKCGKKVSEDDLFCKYCGSKIEKNEEVKAEVIVENNNKSEENKNGLRTASIVLGILALVGNLFIVFSFLSVFLSVIGLILALCATKKGKNVAGIVLNSISIVLSILLIIMVIRFVKMIPKMIQEKLNQGNEIIEKYNFGDDYNFNDIIEGFNRGDFNFNDIIEGFTNGDFDLGDFSTDDFNLDDFYDGNYERMIPGSSSKKETF